MAQEEIIQAEKQTEDLTHKEVFTNIWISPRKVFKYLNERKCNEYITLLLILASISNSFSQAASRHSGDKMSLIGVIGMSIVIGGFFGWISYYIFAALLSWTGKWLRGKGDFESLLRILSYSMIPSIVALIILVPQIIIFGNGTFQEEVDMSGMGFTLVFAYYFTAFLELVLGIWSIILLVIGTSEVQKFSIGKSILNLVLPLLIIFIPIGMIAFILADLLK